VLNGISARHKQVRIILSHAGGFVPYASHRFAELARVFRVDAQTPSEILSAFRRFYFDTALSAGNAALPTLKAFAGADHILFGSDFPYVSREIAASFTRSLDAYGDLTLEERAAINHGNAIDLFPRLRETASVTSLEH
jgi:aminocarboxymuconate-semialdehyde decarboxylase